MIISDLFNNPVDTVLLILAIIVALTIHEFAHALVAYLQGDHTAEDAGRLTLNPLRHIDFFGFLIFILAGFGWAKPTPFNPYNLKYKRFGPVFVALAGPAINMIFGLIILGALKILSISELFAFNNLMVVFFWKVFGVNVALALFNLIPIPPLDGSKVLYAFLVNKKPDVIIWMERNGIYLLIALLVLGDGILNRYIGSVTVWLVDRLYL